MNARYWLVIKDDTTRTFEVCGQEENDNAFHNKVYSFQKAGMNVTSVVLPVSAKFANKEVIKFIGYNREDGLYQRLQSKYRNITLSGIEFYEED